MVTFSSTTTHNLGVHGKELISVRQQGFVVAGTKVTGITFEFFYSLTGDVNVPAGKLSFLMLLNRAGRVGRGRMHLADTGYKV